MIEELSEIIKYESCLPLKHVWERIENLFCHIDRVCDNNDFGNSLEKNDLINITSNSKEFSFRAHNIDYVIKSFDHWFIVNIDMYYRWSDIVLDTGIRYYESIGQRVGRFNS